MVETEGKSMKESHKRIFVLAATVVFSSFLFIGLYHFDNKYSDRSIQAANGLLVLSEEEIQNNPIRYLVKGWGFYPDCLLSPEDFRDGEPDQYMVYTNIGERTRFDNLGAKKDTHGSGTYVLHLQLPKGKTTYALDLPEIFSAYRLYIGERLYLSMGNPDPEQYEPLTQRRLITFEAEGKVTILLAVSDYSHFYSGLVYPPAFGTPLALNTARGMLLGICLFIDTIGLIAAALALYAGLRLKHKNALLFSFTCIVMCGFTSYALLHSVVALPIFPWYALELCLGYLLTFLVVVLHNRICNVGYFIRNISAGVAGAFCLLALCYGFFSPWLTVPIKELFSLGVFLFKAGTAAYLLVTAAISLRGKRERVEPLFYASVFYATAFVWDRILPDFEPMVSGWFSEWGSLILVLFIGYTLWRDIMSAYAYSLAFAEEHRQVTRQLTMQTEYSKQIAQRSEENRRILHDFRQHLRAIGGLALQVKERKGATDLGQQLMEYLDGISQENRRVTGSFAGAFSKNASVDALLQYYFSLAQEEKINVDFRLQLPSGLNLTDVELCTVLGNLLENAVEACQKLSGCKTNISILTTQTPHRCIIQVVNTFDGYYKQRDGRFLSGKRNHSSFGIGLESAREIIERHNGNLIFDIEQTLFCVGVSLPIEENR